MEKYFGIHNHTHYSNIRLIDCINRPKDLINKAIELGLSGIAITDHECLSAHMEVNQYAQELLKTNPDFKIALGNEIYLTFNRDRGQKYYHFILIAKDAEGHKALREMSSIAWHGMYNDRKLDRVPLLKSELQQVMNKYKGHVIATTACIGGELAHHILADDMVNAHSFVFEMMNIFGSDDFYIELQPSQSIEQMNFNLKVLKEYSDSCQFIISTDAHYQNKEDFEYEDDLNFMSRRYKDCIMLFLLNVIIDRFNKDESPMTAKELAHTYHLPIRLVSRWLSRMEDVKVLRAVFVEGKEERTYQPAMDTHIITVGMIFERIDSQGAEQFLVHAPRELQEFWTRFAEMKHKHNSLNDILVIDL